MFYTVYKITNKINNKIYVGVHKTTNLDDGYMGSGKLIKRAQEKYGLENFEKEILHICETSEEMYDLESIIVNEDFVDDKNTYNLKVGGEGGFDHLNSDKEQMTIRAKNGMAAARKAWEKEFGEEWESILAKNAVSHRTAESYKEAAIKATATVMERYGHGTFYGKKHSEESKKKISNSMKGKCVGDKNSQAGTCWVYSLEFKENKKIKKDELEQYLNDGWCKGRKMKF